MEFVIADRYKLTVVCCIVFTSVASAQPSDRVLDAIKMVESGGRENPPDGDGGWSIGPYQIGRAYHTDAVAYDKTIGGTYEDCRKEPYARKVVIAYVTRYLGQSPKDEDVAKLHNAGPNFRKKTGKAVENLRIYWNKVKKLLKT